jgi:uncharacterized cupin superfamily protein
MQVAKKSWCTARLAPHRPRGYLIGAVVFTFWGVALCADSPKPASTASTVTGGREVVRIAYGAAMDEHVTLDTWRVPGRPMPSIYSIHTLYRSSDKLLEAGLAEFGIGWLRIVDYPRNEVDYVVSGTVILHGHDSAAPQLFKSGDHFVLPMHFSGIFEIPETTKFVYVLENRAQPHS